MPSSLYDVMESMERYELVGREINFFRLAWFYVQVEFVMDCVSDSHY